MPKSMTFDEFSDAGTAVAELPAQTNTMTFDEFASEGSPSLPSANPTLKPMTFDEFASEGQPSAPAVQPSPVSQTGDIFDQAAQTEAIQRLAKGAPPPTSRIRGLEAYAIPITREQMGLEPLRETSYAPEELKREKSENLIKEFVEKMGERQYRQTREKAEPLFASAMEKIAKGEQPDENEWLAAREVGRMYISRLIQGRDPYDYKPEKGKVGVAETFRRKTPSEYMSYLPFVPGGTAGVLEYGGALKRLQEQPYDRAAERAIALELSEWEYQARRSPVGYDETERVDMERAARERYRTASVRQEVEDLMVVGRKLLRDREYGKRGKTIVAGAAEIGAAMPAWMIEFGVGGAATGARNLIGRTTTGKLLAWGGRAALRSGMQMHRVTENYLTNQLPEGFYLDDTGKLIVTKGGDNPFTSLMKAYGAVVIENASEEAGKTLVKGGKRFLGAIPGAKQLAQRITDKLAPVWIKMGKGRTLAGFRSQLLKPGGFDGVIEEMTEEQLAAVLHAAGGTENYRGNNPIERIIDAMKSQPYLEEAIVFGVMGGGQAAVSALSAEREAAPEAKEAPTAAVIKEVVPPPIEAAKPSGVAQEATELLQLKQRMARRKELRGLTLKQLSEMILRRQAFYFGKGESSPRMPAENPMEVKAKDLVEMILAEEAVSGDMSLPKPPGVAQEAITPEKAVAGQVVNQKDLDAIFYPPAEVDVEAETKKAISAAESMGYWVVKDVAATGTTYLTLTPQAEDAETITMRISDHEPSPLVGTLRGADAYTDPDFRVDPGGHSVEYAIARIAQRTGQNVPELVRNRIAEANQQQIEKQATEALREKEHADKEAKIAQRSKEWMRNNPESKERLAEIKKLFESGWDTSGEVRKKLLYNARRRLEKLTGQSYYEFDIDAALSVSEPPAKGKEAWEITRQDYINQNAQFRPVGKTPSQRAAITRAFNKTGAEHARIVQEALSEGKPVPAAVLAEYPDLAKPAEAKPQVLGPPSAARDEVLQMLEREAKEEAERAKAKVVEAPAPRVAEAEGGKGIEGGPIAKDAVPVSMEAAQKSIGIPDIINRISELFGVPLRIGRIRSKHQGIYKYIEKVVRTKGYGDLATTSHEVAHHLYREAGLKSQIPNETKGELRALDYEPEKRRLNEGFAEYVRHYLTMDDAAEVAPKFHNWFTKQWLPRNQFKTAIAETKKMVTQWREQGAVARVTSHIDKESARKKAVRAIYVDPIGKWQRLLGAFGNRFQPLVNAMYSIAGTRQLADIPIGFQFGTAAKVLTMTGPSKARQAVISGMIDWMGNKVGPGLKDVLAPINADLRNPDTAVEFEAFLYARHAMDVHKAGKNPGISVADAQFVMNRFKNREGWTKASDGITKWHDQLLDYLIDSGGLTADAKEKMRSMYPHYVPLLRVMETEQRGIGAGGKRLADLPPGVKRMKGSGRPIISPLESSILYAERIITLADKIRVGKMFIDAAEKYKGAGEFIEKVPPNMRPATASVERIKGQLEAAGVALNEADMDAAITIFQNLYQGGAKENIIILWRNGKQELYQVKPDIYRSLMMIDQQFRLPRVLDWIFGKPARLFRLTATGIKAGFGWVTNPLRDVQTAAMQTRTTGWKATLPSIIIRSTHGVIHDIFGDEVARLYKAGGGEMAQPLGIDRRFTQEALDEVLAVHPKDKVLDWMQHPVDSLRRLFSVTELGPRIAEFEAALKETGWKPGQDLTIKQYLTAQIRAANVTVDFREGGWLSMWINRVTPFHNAQVQGPNRMVQAFRNRPVTSALRALAWITLPSIGLWWLYKDEEWYKELPAYEKWRYWHVKYGDTIIRIPTPFEWAMVFGTMVVGTIDSIYQRDPSIFTGAASETLDSLIPAFVPTTPKPITEAITNWDFFRKGPVVSKGLERLKPEDQYYGYTTETAKAVGKMLGISPAKIEHVIGGHTAQMGTDLLRYGETALREAGALPKKGAMPPSLTDIPAAGRLFLRPGTTKVFDDFYTKLEKVGQEGASAKLAGREISLSDKSVQREMNRASDRLSDLRKETKTLINRTDITDGEKRREWTKIHFLMVRIARYASQGNREETYRAFVDFDKVYPPEKQDPKKRGQDFNYVKIQHARGIIEQAKRQPDESSADFAVRKKDTNKKQMDNIAYLKAAGVTLESAGELLEEYWRTLQNPPSAEKHDGLLDLLAERWKNHEKQSK